MPKFTVNEDLREAAERIILDRKHAGGPGSPYVNSHIYFGHGEYAPTHYSRYMDCKLLVDRMLELILEEINEQNSKGKD